MSKGTNETHKTMATSPVMVFKSIKAGNKWEGADWTIADEDALAELIARIAVGQHLHVMRVLEETGTLPYAPTQNAKDGAIALLTATKPGIPYQRDGWMFQAISWIAANLQDATTLKSPPHIIPADKGFDGLHLRLDETNTEVISVIICEDKATDGPRGKIQGQVWPEFEEMESGRRENELVSETSTLLAQNSHVDPERAVHEILWQRARAYRVSITVGDKEHSDDGREALFKGYDEVVTGSAAQRRRAETFYQENLRQWMDHMAAKAIAAVCAMEASDV
ncbi:MAG: hypothetical protein F4X40_05760 [Chloroflexi bacterium]|nr:hypothetical protein [Chloroflexota bacterium]